ncbi:hypothetical protein EJB05_40424, partial [Eragrostis curvula]
MRFLAVVTCCGPKKALKQKQMRWLKVSHNGSCTSSVLQRLSYQGKLLKHAQDGRSHAPVTNFLEAPLIVPVADQSCKALNGHSRFFSRY